MTRNTFSTAALFWLTLMSTASLAAQQPGDTVRVSGDVIAEFVRADDRGIHLSTGFVSYGDIESFELKTGERSWAAVGTLIGLGAGMGLGTIVAAVGGKGDLGSDAFAGLLAVGCVVGGAVIGGVAGSRKRTPKFAAIPLPEPTVGLMSSRRGQRGLALGVRWRF